MKLVERDRFLREIFRLVLVEGPIARGEIMDRLAISRASVTRFAAPLIEQGIVEEAPVAEVGVPGRPTRPLRINSSSRTFVGVKLTGSLASAVLTDLMAGPLGVIELPIPHGATADKIADLIVEAARELDPSETFSAVGVSLGGLVTPGGAVEHEDFLGLTGVALADMVRARLKCPVVLENDVVALAVAEQWFGAGRGIDSFAVLTIGVGVGYGLVVKDQVIDTQRAREGLIGHLPLWEDGPPCHLGHPGCATALLTSTHIMAQLRTVDPTLVSLSDALASDDPDVKGILDRSARALGRTIAEIAILGMVQRVVLSGEGVALYDGNQRRVHDAIRKYSPSRIPVPELILDRSGFDVWARGAAAVAIQHVVLTITA